MALAFTQSQQHWVNHGSAASIDNLAQSANGMTICQWVYRTANGVNQTLCSKDGAGTTGFNFLINNDQAEGGLRFIVFRSSVTDFQSSGGEVALNTWTFVAVTFDDSLGTEADIYTGTLTSMASEVSYAVTTSGSGTPTDDSSIDLYVGNVVRANTNPIAGRIATTRVWNRRLTLAEIQQTQFDHFTQNSGSVINSIYNNPSLTQPDLSGNGNNGTVTGAAQANHVPIGAPFRGDAWVPYIVSATQYELIANSGSYTVSGANAGLDASRLLTANAGSYNLLGTNADLDASRLLTANSGAYTYNGTNADLDASRLLTANAGSYTLSGTDADLEKLFVLNANAGAYTYAGTNADLDASRLLTANSGSYTYTGTSADLDRQYLLTSNSGTYTYTGTNSTLIKSSSLSASSGSYIISGTDVELTASGIIWTVQTDETTTWSAQSDESTTWSQQSDESTTWTVQ